MSNNMTTTQNGFRVEDVTFRKARRQCEIDNEIEHEDVVQEEVKAPVSLTPEQVKKYLLKTIQSSNSEDEKRVFAQVIKWIDELAETKKELVQHKLKEMQLQNSEETPDDIE